jgi:hypothetical protein
MSEYEFEEFEDAEEAKETRTVRSRPKSKSKAASKKETTPVLPVMDADFSEIQGLIERRSSEGRNFTKEEKRRIMRFIEKAQKQGMTVAALVDKVGIHKKWYRKWTEQFARE